MIIKMPQHGERRKLVIRPNPEYNCPNCGSNFGEKWLEKDPNDQGLIVTVGLRAGPFTYCQECVHFNRTPAEGMWTVRIRGSIVHVPYTWLEEIKES